MKKNVIFLISIFTLWGCCKDKKIECIDGNKPVLPFVEKFAGFWCNEDVEYEYIFRKREQIDSLYPNCFFPGSTAFPLTDNEVVYFIFGKIAYHKQDTFITTIFKDTCANSVTYEINMVQRDTSLNEFPGVMPIFCTVENIPADYEVEIKYKYVPLP